MLLFLFSINSTTSPYTLQHLHNTHTHTHILHHSHIFTTTHHIKLYIHIYVHVCIYVRNNTHTHSHICTYYLSLHLLAVPSVAPQIPTHKTHTHSRSGSSTGVRGNGITWYLAANSSSSNFSAAASANCCSTVSTNV